MRELMMVADLGASKILAAISTPQGEILAREKLATRPGRSPEIVIEEICLTLQRLGDKVAQPGDYWRGAAVATPGPLSFPQGTVTNSPNLGWQEVHLQKELSIRLGQEVMVEKDTNMAVLGEYHFGQQKKYQHLLYITVSTGIGGGLLLSGKLYRGASGGAGEIGHMMMKPGGPICGCGRQGCLEAVASGRAVARMAQELKGRGWGKGYQFPDDDWGAREIGEAARLGDEQACALVAKVTDYLGDGIANLVNIFNPQLVVLGGSMALGWIDLLSPHLEEYVTKIVFPLNARHFRLEYTSLGDNIVILGCVTSLLKSKTVSP